MRIHEKQIIFVFGFVDLLKWGRGQECGGEWFKYELLVIVEVPYRAPHGKPPHQVCSVACANHHPWVPCPWGRKSMNKLSQSTISISIAIN